MQEQNHSADTPKSRPRHLRKSDLNFILSPAHPTDILHARLGGAGIQASLAKPPIFHRISTPINRLFVQDFAIYLPRFPSQGHVRDMHVSAGVKGGHRVVSRQYRVVDQGG